MPKKEKISAQSQVGGKVNSGIMNAVVGIGESADFTIGTNEYGPGAYYHVDGQINEKVSPEDIDLSSFNIKKALNPNFWKNNKLDSRIRLALLDISDDFIASLNVPWVEAEDVLLTGSLANFNWSEDGSDIDLHVLMDFKEVDEKVELVKNYFDSKKNEWNKSHKNLRIMGFPVEVYVQDVNEKHVANGIYSLDKNMWINVPEREKLSAAIVNKDFIKDKVSDYMNRIDKLAYLIKNQKDKHKVEKIGEKANKLLDLIKSERKIGFKVSDSDEMNSYNIMFKTLRRNGYIGKLKDIIQYCEDFVNSIP